MVLCRVQVLRLSRAARFYSQDQAFGCTHDGPVVDMHGEGSAARDLDLDLDRMQFAYRKRPVHAVRGEAFGPGINSDVCGGALLFALAAAVFPVWHDRRAMRVPLFYGKMW